MASIHHLPLETPVLPLPCSEAFDALSAKEKRYTHHLSRASWWGTFIVLSQSSPESCDIFCLLTKLFRAQPLDSLKKVAVEKGVLTEEEFQLLLVYYCGFTYNGGNYLGFGDRKFVPSLPRDKLLALIHVSKAYLENPDQMTAFYSRCSASMYDLSENKKFLGMWPTGVTMYFSRNCTAADGELCKRYLTSRDLEAWNTRVIKHETDGKVTYDIRLASIETDHLEGLTRKGDEFEGAKFVVTRGDYSQIMSKIVEEFKLAKNFAANDTEVKMLEKYVESFTTGSVDAHKKGSIHWVNNKSPAVELYTGFIEVYRDPTQLRAEFESFVAIVNREQSKKFDVLVQKAEKEILPHLPWGPDFEDDKFMVPDFSSLDVVTFATSGLPIGINIPNYKDVKEEHGFKNTSLTNVLKARSGDKVAVFISKEDQQLKEKYSLDSLEICVGLHELLGHGSGKFLRRKDDGKLNFDIEKLKNPFTGEPVTFYEKGENYQTKFTDLGSAYEECRAETVAMYLCLRDDILDIFNIAPADKDAIKYQLWMDMFLSGIKGLEMYQLDQGKWGQAHCSARYVILRVALEHGDGVVKVTETVGEDGLPDLLITLDRSKILTSGRAAMGDFLRKLQVYRSMGDAAAGRKLFEHYAAVPADGPHPFARWHEIVVRKRRPRMVLTMPNTRPEAEASARLATYPAGLAGNVQSWVERWSADEYEFIEKLLPRIMDTRDEARP